MINYIEVIDVLLNTLYINLLIHIRIKHNT